MLRRSLWAAAAATTATAAAAALCDSQPTLDNQRDISRELRARVARLRTQGVPARLPLSVSAQEGDLVSIHFALFPGADRLPVLASALGKLGETRAVEFHSAASGEGGEGVAVTFEGGSAQLTADGRFQYFRDEAVDAADLDAVMAAYRAANEQWGRGQLTQQPHQTTDPTDPRGRLEKLGLQVFMPDEDGDGLDWSALAGYEHVKRAVDDTIILALRHPEVYDEVARGTRERFESNRPRAVLFEGPPGTGKTLTARIVARLAGVPMVHLPVERVVSKWHGESERQLAEVFDACDAMGGALVFIDEIDALATARGGGGETHEVTRRMLSVLLQRIEGFSSASAEDGRTTLVCATNRKGDLDAALLDRFDLLLTFPLPDQDTRTAVFARYARHLRAADHRLLAARVGARASCRDIKEVCEAAERACASRLVRGEGSGARLPTREEYEAAVGGRFGPVGS